IEVALFLDRRHRNSPMQGVLDLVDLGPDPIVESGEALMDLAPERDPVGDLRLHHDRAEAGDVVVPDAAILAARLDKGYLQPVTGLAKTDKHGVVACKLAATPRLDGLSRWAPTRLQATLARFPVREG